jgi:hypothetical protein
MLEWSLALRIVSDSTWSHTSERTFGVGTLSTPESRGGNIVNARKKPYHVLDFYGQDWHWMGSFFYSYPCDLVLLHKFLSGDIFLVRDFCWLRWWCLQHWHLGIDMCWMSPHTSSIWPWSGTPKVSLYDTFLSGLHHYFSTFFALFTASYLFPPLNTLLSCYYYQIYCLHVLLYMYWASAIKICENNPLVFLVYWIFAIILPIFGIFHCIPPIFTLMYTVKLILHLWTYHNEHTITLE